MDAQINFSPADYREQLAEIEGYSRVSCAGVAARSGRTTEPAAQPCPGYTSEGAAYTRACTHVLPPRWPPQDEVVAYVRRRSSAFSRGKSRFRGVSGHNGRWEARIGSFGGRKNVRNGR